MIAKPEAFCPRCGGRFTVLDAVAVSRHAETVTYYCECDCGAAEMTVTQGRVTGIVPREPLQVPDDPCEPLGSQEDPDYMAY